MGATLRNWHLDTRRKRCVPVDVITPKPKYAEEVRKEDVKWTEKLDTVHMAAAKKILKCSKTMSNTTLRTELGMHPPETETIEIVIRSREHAEKAIARYNSQESYTEKNDKRAGWSKVG